MNQKTSSLVHALRYQTMAGIHTYGACSMTGCKKIARGSAHCPDCTTVELAKIIGTKEAQHLHYLYHKLGGIQSDIDELIGEL